MLTFLSEYQFTLAYGVLAFISLGYSVMGYLSYDLDKKLKQLVNH